MRGAELPYTWAELQAKIQAGDFSNLYVGDYKEITLTTGEEVVMEVAGIDTSYDATRIVHHHVDFISRNCLAEPRQFNAADTNNGTADKKNPWLASDLYNALNNESSGVYATLPENLKPYIIQKHSLIEERYSAAGAVARNTYWNWQDIGKLWLPTEIEVFGAIIWSDPVYGGGRGVQYPIFALAGYNRIIKKMGEAGGVCYWAESSASMMNVRDVCHVGTSGFADHNRATLTGNHEPLCFRIG